LSPPGTAWIAKEGEKERSQLRRRASTKLASKIKATHLSSELLDSSLQTVRGLLDRRVFSVSEGRKDEESQRLERRSTREMGPVVDDDGRWKGR